MGDLNGRLDNNKKPEKILATLGLTRTIEFYKLYTIKKRNPKMGTRTIAKKLDLSRNTIKNALRSENPPAYKRKTYTNPELKPFQEYITEQYLIKKLKTTKKTPIELFNPDEMAVLSPLPNNRFIGVSEEIRKVFVTGLSFPQLYNIPCGCCCCCRRHYSLYET